MYSKVYLIIFYLFLITSGLYTQTNVGGYINSDSTWTLSASPYNITSSVTVRNGATLTIENGVEVIFPGSSSIIIGSSASSTGQLIANEVEFTSLYSGDSRINIRYASSSASFNNCTFDNVYLYADDAKITVISCGFDNCNYPVSLNNEAKIIASAVTFGSNNTHNGIEWNGIVSNDYTLSDYGISYFIDGLTINTGSTLIIEDGVKVFIPGSSGIYIGSSSTSTGNFIANSVIFTGSGSSDGQIYFRANSTGEIDKCSFKNAYLNIDESSPSIKNCKFSRCSYAIYLRNDASPVIQDNDFFNNTTAIRNTSTITVSAENNYWGHFSGPENMNNPEGIGQPIEGPVSFQPFSTLPINGSIQPQFTLSAVEVDDAKVGSYKDTEVKLLTSSGDIDLLVTDIQADPDVFTVRSSKYFWVTNGDTVSVKIRLTPNSSILYSGNLYLYTNQQKDIPISIPLKGRGTSYLVVNPDTIDFGKVDINNYRTLNLKLKNEGTTSIRIDSIVSTNPDFSYILGGYPLSINDYLYQNESTFSKKNRSSINALSAFYLSAGDSEKVLITFKPSIRNIETGYLKVYYSGSAFETVYLTAEGYAAPVAIRISGINYQNFPFIYMNVLADTFGTGIYTLTKDNFQVYEDGVLQNSHFNVTPPGEGGGSRLTDIVFIMDNSGSLEDEQDAVSQNVINFVNSLSASGVDYALGLCRYGMSTSSGNPVIEDNGILTTDANYFKNVIWKKNISSGGDEPGYFAIQQSASSFAFRPGAQKVFIIITDETPDQGGATLLDALSVCMNNSITLFALTYNDLYQLFTPITNATNGSVYNITSDFSYILNYISTAVTSSYVIEYSSSSPDFTNEFREVVVKVNYQANYNTDTVRYNPLALPKIQRTTETQNLHEKAWAEGTSFKIEATITDEYEPFVKFAALYVKRTGDSLYSYLPMSSFGNNLYSATIPGGYVQRPGLDYYIIASDSESTTSDPQNHPSSNPYQIAILPNIAPVIDHTPVAFAQLNNEIQINAEVEDQTNTINVVQLYFRKTGQLSYIALPMVATGSNIYSATIGSNYVTRDGLDYYIRATDDFNLSNYHGRYDAPHKISVAATLATAQIDTLSIGPSIQNVIVPANGAGYCYFDLRYQTNPINSGSFITVKLWRQNDLYETEGTFIKPGWLRIKIPGYILTDSLVTFTLANQISIGDTLFSIDPSPFLIKAEKIPSQYARSWDVFAGGSAGVSGSAGSIGAGVSASAAKLSVKGSAGAGFTIQRDEKNRIVLDRRIEASIAANLSVPQLNGAAAQATVGSASITVKALLGQSYSFSDLNLSEERKKMAQSGFLLETLSIGGVGLSPIAGVILQAIIDGINSLGGVSSTFNDAHISNYYGTGLEGSIGVGFQMNAGNLSLSALTSTASFALGLKFTDYFRNNLDKGFYKFSSLNSNAKSIELTQAFSFNFSELDFGLKASDKVDLGGGNFSLFDAGVGTEINTAVNLDASNNFDGLSVSLKGGGGVELFGSSTSKYFNTSIDFPKEYGQVLQDVGSSLAGFFISSRGIPLGKDLVNVTVQSLKDAYNNIKPVPLTITTSEIRGRGFSLDLGIDLDAALGVGLGVSLGINAKYYNELSFPKKVSNVYINGNNFLLRTSNYSTDMEGDNFKEVVKELLSGTLPLIKNAFNNLLETVTEIVVAGKKFVISIATSAGDAVGEIAGDAQAAGSWVVSHVTSWLPMSYQNHQFEKPVFRKMYYSTRVMHPVRGNLSDLTSADAKLVLVSQSMIVNFIKEGETNSVDTVEASYQIKMVIHDDILLENNFTVDDKDKVKLYYYDDNLMNWILIGGTRVRDSLAASTNRLGAFALGIEVNSQEDSRPPVIRDYGPKTGSILTAYPEIYMVVSDDIYGSGLDLSKTFIILNNDTLDFSYDLDESKVFYQLSALDSIITSDVSVKMVCTDLAGNSVEENSQFTLNITGINNKDKMPDKFNLYQNYPNPFNPSTTIKFDLPVRTNVEINIYDIRGSFVGTLFSGKMDAGHHSIIWKAVDQYGSKVASGVYFYQIKTPEFNQVKKMEVIK